MPEKIRLTKTAVQALPPAPSGKRAFHYDTATPGLAVQVTASGTKTFSVYRKVQGKPERVRLGTFPAMTVEQARRKAAEILRTIAKGQSPGAKKLEQQAQAVTLAEVFEEYLSGRDLKPGTVHDYRRVMREAFPDWQDRRVVDITRNMVERRHAQLGERSHARANNAMRVLRTLMNFAAGKFEDAKGRPLVTDIPTRRLSATRSWYRVERRQTVIKPHQLRPWWEAVGALESETVAEYLQVLVLTGLRRSEAARLTWDDVDLGARTLTVRDTKNRRPHTFPLSDYLLDLFIRPSEAAARGTVYAFPATTGAGHLVEPRKSMGKVIADTGITFTPHDLRRTFATIAESLDLSAYALKMLLNHKTAADVTRGYIIADVERLREPMQRITDFVLRCVGARETATVVNIQGQQRAQDW
jgi:integrase